MTFPIDIHLGFITVPSHLVLETLAFYIGVKYYFYLKEKNPVDLISNEHRLYIVIGAALGAFIGSRLLGFLEHVEIIPNIPLIFSFLNSQTIVGGLAGGILGVEITKKIIGIKTSSGDLFVFPLIISMIIGRIGCFLAGVSDHTVGNPSNFFWAFDQGDGIPRHPTSLYEIIFLFLLYFVLKNSTQKSSLLNGIVFRVFIISYFTFRLLIEFIKPVEIVFLGLSLIQIVCILFAGYYILTIHKNLTWKNKNQNLLK